MSTWAIFISLLAAASLACNTSPAPSLTAPVPTPSPGPAAPVVPSAPTITSVSPSTAIVGSGDLTLTITGTGFRDASREWMGSSFAIWSDGDQPDLLTRYVSETQLTAILPKKFLETARGGAIRVVNGDSMGWSDGYRGYAQSNSIPFTVVAAP
jgi:hypothetical protein